MCVSFGFLFHINQTEHKKIQDASHDVKLPQNGQKPEKGLFFFLETSDFHLFWGKEWMKNGWDQKKNFII